MNNNKITLKEFFDGKDDLCIHCNTKTQARNLLMEFDKLCKKWYNDNPYADQEEWINEFYVSSRDLVYYNNGTCANIGYAKQKHHKIYEFEDIIFEDEILKELIESIVKAKIEISQQKLMYDLFKIFSIPNTMIIKEDLTENYFKLIEENNKLKNRIKELERKN